MFVHTRQISLRTGRSHFGSLAQPSNSFCVIFAGSIAISTELPEICLRLWLSLLRRRAVPLGGVSEVFFHSTAPRIHDAQITLCGRQALLSSLSEPSDGSGVVLLHSGTGEVCKS